MLIYIPHRISKSNAYNAINTKVSSLDYEIRFGQIASQLEKKNLLLRKIIITETMTIKILLLLLL